MSKSTAVKPGTLYLDLTTKELYFDDPSGTTQSHQKVIDASTLLYNTTTTFPTSNVVSGLLTTRNNKTFAPLTLIGNIYNADGTVFDAITKNEVNTALGERDTRLTTLESDVDALESYFTNVSSAGALGNSKKHIYIADGKFKASSSTVGGTAKPMYLKSGTMTAISATVGGELQLTYLNAGTITASTTSKGSSSAPVYLNAGVIDEISAIDTAHGGTGATAHTANRLVWSTSASKLEAANNHYVDANKLGINSTSAPSYNLYVNGTTGLKGNVTIDNGTLTLYRETSKADDNSAKIAFKIKQTDTPVETSGAYIAVYDDHDANNYGTNMVITSPSALIIGGGESAANFYDATVKGKSTEATYITSDGSVYFYTNCNTIGNRVGVVLNTSREFYPEATSTGSANGSIGNANYNWSTINARKLTSNDTLTLNTVSGKAIYITSGSTAYIDSGSGSSIIFRPQGTEQGRFNTSGQLQIKSTGAANATIIGPGTAGTFYFPNTGGTFVTHATRGTAVGGDTIPVYIASTGRATAVAKVGVGAGGTGVTSQTANRLVWSIDASKIQASKHYANATKIAINSESEPTENFYVNGTAKVSGNASIVGTVTIGNGCTLTYNSTQKSLKFVFI